MFCDLGTDKTKTPFFLHWYRIEDKKIKRNNTVGWTLYHDESQFLHAHQCNCNCNVSLRARINACAITRTLYIFFFALVNFAESTHSSDIATHTTSNIRWSDHLFYFRALKHSIEKWKLLFLSRVRHAADKWSTTHLFFNSHSDRSVEFNLVFINKRKAHFRLLPATSWIFWWDQIYNRNAICWHNQIIFVRENYSYHQQ